MSKNFKLFLGFTYLLLLAVFLYFIFSNIQINRLNDFLYYKELQLGLENFISANFLINIIYFFIFTAAWVALLGFGSPILIFSGILFGKWIGTIISIISKVKIVLLNTNKDTLFNAVKLINFPPSLLSLLSLGLHHAFRESLMYA